MSLLLRSPLPRVETTASRRPNDHGALIFLQPVSFNCFPLATARRDWFAHCEQPKNWNLTKVGTLTRVFLNDPRSSLQLQKAVGWKKILLANSLTSL